MAINVVALETEPICWPQRMIDYRQPADYGYPQVGQVNVPDTALRIPGVGKFLWLGRAGIHLLLRCVRPLSLWAGWQPINLQVALQHKPGIVQAAHFEFVPGIEHQLD